MQSILERAKQIRLAIFDVDGVLTSGALFYGSSGIELKAFHVHDGLGLRLLQKSGIEVAIITAKQSDIVTRRMNDLEIKHVYQNQHNKLLAYEELKQKLKLTDAAIAYTGDDLPDVPLLQRVGLSITVANAPASIKQYAHFVTQAKGGKGAAREICELILQAQGTYDEVVKEYVARESV